MVCLCVAVSAVYVAVYGGGIGNFYAVFVSGPRGCFASHNRGIGQRTVVSLYGTINDNKFISYSVAAAGISGNDFQRSAGACFILYSFRASSYVLRLRRGCGQQPPTNQYSPYLHAPSFFCLALYIFSVLHYIFYTAFRPARKVIIRQIGGLLSG